jgi:hypothetical protein
MTPGTPITAPSITSGQIDDFVEAYVDASVEE